MIKKMASAILWTLVGLAAPADDSDAWTDDGLDGNHRPQTAEIRNVIVMGLVENQDRPAAWVAKKSDRPLAVATVGDGPQPFVAEMQIAFLSIADPAIGLELIDKGLAQARQRGVLKVLIDPGTMPHDPIKQIAEARGFHFYRNRVEDGATQLEFLVDLYWRAPIATT
jgi:hypothetical protein